MALMKSCRCGKKIEYIKQRCDSCESKRTAERRSADRYYDKYKRDSKSDKFYYSKSWENIRLTVMNKHRNIDLYEYFVNKKLVVATTVHHIVEIKDDWDRRLDLSNLVPLSDKSHKVIHRMYKKNKKATQDLLFSLLLKSEETLG